MSAMIGIFRGGGGGGVSPMHILCMSLVRIHQILHNNYYYSYSYN